MASGARLTAGARTAANAGAAVPGLRDWRGWVPGRERIGDLRAAGDLGVTAARALRGWFPRSGDWALRRSLSPNSLSGISLLLALCAAAWLSGGATSDVIRGGLAMLGWLLAAAAARRLANFAAARQASMSAGSLVRAARGLDGSTDWLVLPGMYWPEADRTARTYSRTLTVRGIRNFPWLAAVSAATAEFAIYGGMAAFGQADRWTSMWPLAVLTIVSVTVTAVILRSADLTEPARPVPARPGIRRVIGATLDRFLNITAGTRVLIAWIALAAHGPRIALFVIFIIEVITGITAVVRRARRGRRNLSEYRRAGATSASAGYGAGRAGAGRAGENQEAGAQSDAYDGPAVARACRDDGPVAHWTGRVVQGKLTPLPPLLLGVAATIMLAVLGMRHLPGIVVLAPLTVLLLAAPGSGHPHDGPADWLVPPLLLVGQFVYLAALGFAQPVTGPAVFVLCALTGVWYVNLAAGTPQSAGVVDLGILRRRGRPARSGALTTGIGWEGRMFLAGLAAIFGIATFGYVGLAAYLGLLIGRRALAAGQQAGEDDGL